MGITDNSKTIFLSVGAKPASIAMQPGEDHVGSEMRHFPLFSSAKEKKDKRNTSTAQADEIVSHSGKRAKVGHVTLLTCSALETVVTRRHHQSTGRMAIHEGQSLAKGSIRLQNSPCPQEGTPETKR